MLLLGQKSSAQEQPRSRHVPSHLNNRHGHAEAGSHTSPHSTSKSSRSRAVELRQRRTEELSEAVQRAKEVRHGLPLAAWALITRFLPPETNVKLARLTYADYMSFMTSRTGELFRSDISPDLSVKWYDIYHFVLNADPWISCRARADYFLKVSGVRHMFVEGQCAEFGREDLVLLLKGSAATLTRLTIFTRQDPWQKRVVDAVSHGTVPKLHFDPTVFPSTATARKLQLPSLTALAISGPWSVVWMGILRVFRMDAVGAVYVLLPPVTLDTTTAEDLIMTTAAGVTRFLGGLSELRLFRLEADPKDGAVRRVASACLRWIAAPGASKHIEVIELAGENPRLLVEALHTHLTETIQRAKGVPELVVVAPIVRAQTEENPHTSPPLQQGAASLPRELEAPVARDTSGVLGSTDVRLYLGRRRKQRTLEAGTVPPREQLLRLLEHDRARHNTRKAVKDIRSRTSRLRTLRIDGVVRAWPELVDLALILSKNVTVHAQELDVPVRDPLCGLLLTLLGERLRRLRLSLTPPVAGATVSSRVPVLTRLVMQLRAETRQEPREADTTLYRNAEIALRQALESLPAVHFGRLETLSLVDVHPRETDPLLIALSRWDFGTSSAGSPERAAPRLALDLPVVEPLLKHEGGGLQLCLVFNEPVIKGHETLQDPELLRSLHRIIKCVQPASVTFSPIPAPSFLARFHSITHCASLTLKPFTTTRLGARWSQLTVPFAVPGTKLTSTKRPTRITHVSVGSLVELHWLFRCALEADGQALRPAVIRLDPPPLQSLVAVAFAWDNYPLARQLGTWHVERLIQNCFHHLTLADAAMLYDESLRVVEAYYTLPIDLHFAPMERVAEFFLYLRRAFRLALESRNCDHYVITVDPMLRHFPTPLPRNLCPLPAEHRATEELTVELPEPEELQRSMSVSAVDQQENERLLSEVQKLKEEREKEANEVFMKALMAIGVSRRPSSVMTGGSQAGSDQQQSAVLPPLSQEDHLAEVLSAGGTTTSDISPAAALILRTSETLLAAEVPEEEEGVVAGAAVPGAAVEQVDVSQLRDLLRMPSDIAASKIPRLQTRVSPPGRDSAAERRYTLAASNRARRTLESFQKELLDEELKPPPPLLWDMTGAYRDCDVASPPYPDGGILAVRIIRQRSAEEGARADTVESARSAVVLAERLRAWANTAAARRPSAP